MLLVHNAPPSLDASIPLARAEQRAAKADPARGGFHVALVGRRVVGLDTQHDKGRAVTLAQQAAALGEIGLACECAGAFDAGAGRDFFEVDAEAGVALLVAGLAVMAVPLTIDTQLPVDVLSS
jgi:hypothetical protein